MPRKVKVEVLKAPLTIYQHAARMAQGYAPAEDARFAVVREGDGPWQLVHRRSGCAVESCLPALPRKITMTEKLAVAAAWHSATHLDWSPFDGLPQCTHETKRDDIRFSDPAAAGRVAGDMRTLALQALGV